MEGQPVLLLPCTCCAVQGAAGSSSSNQGAGAGVLDALPVWDSYRPHLTGQDLLLSAAQRSSRTAAGGGVQGVNPPDQEALSLLPPPAQEVAGMYIHGVC